jgi:hypothetical protein
MQNKSVLLALLMVFTSYSLSAQQDYLKEPDRNRPSLFSNVPETVPVAVATLELLLASTPGIPVDLSLGGVLRYSGTIESSTVDNDRKLLTVIVTSPSMPGSFLTLSKVITDEKTVSYIARIMSFQHGDCMVLKKNTDNTYSFIKKKFYEIVGE